MAIVNLNIKSLIKKRRSNRQKGARQQTSLTHKRSSRRAAKPADTTPRWVDTPDVTILPEGDYMPESTQPTKVAIQHPQQRYTTPVRQLEAPDDVDYQEARQRLGDLYLAATQGFGSDFIRPPRYPKRK